MSTQDRPVIGAISWTDLTVPNADEVRDFYRDVAGWKSQPLEMGGYADYVMTTPDTGHAVAGICHDRGVNAGLPAQWLVYIVVENLTRSIDRCLERGGQVVRDRRDNAGGSFCVIRDPAGAVCALYQPPSREVGGQSSE